MVDRVVALEASNSQLNSKLDALTHMMAQLMKSSKAKSDSSSSDSAHSDDDEDTKEREAKKEEFKAMQSMAGTKIFNKIMDEECPPA